MKFNNFFFISTQSVISTLSPSPSFSVFYLIPTSIKSDKPKSECQIILIEVNSHLIRAIERTLYCRGLSMFCQKEKLSDRHCQKGVLRGGSKGYMSVVLPRAVAACCESNHIKLC